MPLPDPLNTNNPHNVSSLVSSVASGAPSANMLVSVTFAAGVPPRLLEALTMLPSSAAVWLYGCVGSQPPLQPAKEKQVGKPGGSGLTLFGTADTILITPLSKSFALPSQLEVKSLSTDRLSSLFGESGQPQHSPISWSSSKT